MQHPSCLIALTVITLSTLLHPASSATTLNTTLSLTCVNASSCNPSITHTFNISTCDIISFEFIQIVANDFATSDKFTTISYPLGSSICDPNMGGANCGNYSNCNDSALFGGSTVIAMNNATVTLSAVLSMTNISACVGGGGSSSSNVLDLQMGITCISGITSSPSSTPTSPPTRTPSSSPSQTPSSTPSQSPSSTPSTSTPSVTPTMFPSSSPSQTPTQNPTISFSPTIGPSTTNPSMNPTMFPSKGPTNGPTKSPSVTPTNNPATRVPTAAPSVVPSSSPTLNPTDRPTGSPTAFRHEFYRSGATGPLEMQFDCLDPLGCAEFATVAVVGHQSCYNPTISATTAGTDFSHGGTAVEILVDGSRVGVCQPGVSCQSNTMYDCFGVLNGPNATNIFANGTVRLVIGVVDVGVFGQCPIVLNAGTSRQQRVYSRTNVSLQCFWRPGDRATAAASPTPSPEPVNAGLIAGVVLGSIIGCLCLIFCCWYLTTQGCDSCCAGNGGDSDDNTTAARRGSSRKSGGNATENQMEMGAFTSALEGGDAVTTPSIAGGQTEIASGESNLEVAGGNNNSGGGEGLEQEGSMEDNETAGVGTPPGVRPPGRGSAVFV